MSNGIMTDKMPHYRLFINVGKLYSQMNCGYKMNFRKNPELKKKSD
jgi:hypothetical protein